MAHRGQAWAGLSYCAQYVVQDVWDTIDPLLVAEEGLLAVVEPLLMAGIGGGMVMKMRGEERRRIVSVI